MQDSRAAFPPQPAQLVGAVVADSFLDEYQLPHVRAACRLHPTPPTCGILCAAPFSNFKQVFCETFPLEYD